jgi:ABC-2 type transport system ATP-binding protein
MQAIVTRELTKIYAGGRIGKPPSASLDKLDLSIGQNEVFGFLGRNGAGKTTSIKLICSLIHPTRGDAMIFGEDSRLPRARRHIGYLPENPYFYEYLTPRETIDFCGRLQGLDGPSRAKEWNRLAELFDLGEIRGQRVRTFSKGMRQRLGFAVALVGDPPLLILDEPMSGLDPLGRRLFRDVILKLRDDKKTIFFSSHVLSDVEQICDRVGILVSGKLTVQGRLDQLLERRIQSVEVILNGVDKQTEEMLLRRCSEVRRSEAGTHFYVTSLEAANELVRAAMERGAALVEFNPVRESLEDYFMRSQQGGRP